MAMAAAIALNPTAMSPANAEVGFIILPTPNKTVETENVNGLFTASWIPTTPKGDSYIFWSFKLGTKWRARSIDKLMTCVMNGPNSYFDRHIAIPVSYTWHSRIKLNSSGFSPDRGEIALVGKCDFRSWSINVGEVFSYALITVTIIYGSGANNWISKPVVGVRVMVNGEEIT